MTKLPLLFTIVIAVLAIAVSLLIHRRAKAELTENHMVIRQQNEGLAELMAENQRLSNLVVNAKANTGTRDNQAVELARLRAKVADLRRSTNTLAKLAAGWSRIELTCRPPFTV